MEHYLVNFLPSSERCQSTELKAVDKNSKSAEVARYVSRWMLIKCKIPHFSRPISCDHRIMIWIGFGTWVLGSQDTNLYCHVPIYTFYALYVITIHHRYRRTDVMLVA